MVSTENLRELIKYYNGNLNEIDKEASRFKKVIKLEDMNGLDVIGYNVIEYIIYHNKEYTDTYIFEGCLLDEYIIYNNKLNHYIFISEKYINSWKSVNHVEIVKNPSRREDIEPMFYDYLDEIIEIDSIEIFK